MKKFHFFKEIIIPAFILSAICLIVTALLAGTNVLTQSAIEAQDKLNNDAAKRVVLPGSVRFEERSLQNVSYFVGFDDLGNVDGYIFRTSAKGYGGDIEVMTGIAADSKIVGIAMLSHNETPGLGANVANAEFTGQFCQSIAEGGRFNVTKKNDTLDKGEISAVTGATISSRAVTEAVNQAVDCYERIRAEEMGSDE